jgi:cell division septum initiation protein DivIVA
MGNNTASIADYQKSFAVMLAGAEANAAELAGTAEVRNALATAAAGVQSALNRQSDLTGQAQQATRDLEESLDLAKRMYSRLRSGVIMHYGRESEKVVQFGLQPARPPVRSTDRAKKKKQKPEEPGPNPATTAVSETDGTR